MLSGWVTVGCSRSACIALVSLDRHPLLLGPMDFFLTWAGIDLETPRRGIYAVFSLIRSQRRSTGVGQCTMAAAHEAMPKLNLPR